jgi:hypothetical protein
MQQPYPRKLVSVADLMRRQPSAAEAALIVAPGAEPPRGAFRGR